VEYMQEAKMLKVPVRSLLSQKKQAIKKLKNGMRLMPDPDKPTDLPQKPMSAKRIFIREKREEVEDISTIPSLWEGLSPEERAKYDEKHNELLKQYEEAVKTFQEIEDGKTYLRKIKQARRSRAVAVAKDKYLTEEPKKPVSAMAMFFKQALPALKKEQPELKGAEAKKALETKWLTLDEAEKAAIQEKAAKAYSDYEETVKMWKETENYKAYAKVIKGLTKKKPKAKAKGKGKGAKPAPSIAGPKKPAGMPVAPPKAHGLYVKAQSGTGKSLGDMMKGYKDLDPEEKKKYEDEANEKLKQFNEEMDAFNKSDEGKKYLRDKVVFGKRKRIADAKAKYLKDEPKRPANAMMLFCSDKRAEVAKANPDLKGLGPVQKKLGEMWKDLSEEDRKVYTDQHAEQMKAYEEKRQEFESTPDFKKYQALTRGKPKAKAKAKPKAKVGKGKGAGKQPAAPKGPVPPAGMPKKPVPAMTMFASDKKVTGGLGEIAKAWRELGAEGQKEYLEQTREKNIEYDKEMDAFKKTAEGMRYTREKSAFEKKNKMSQAKEKHLGGASGPKQPATAFQLFVQEKRKEMSGEDLSEELQELKKMQLGDQAKKLGKMWSEIGEEDKARIDGKAKELKDEYDKELAEYKNSDAFKKYEKAVKGLSKSKKPKKAKAKAKPVKKAAKVKAKAKAKGAKGKKAAAADSSDSDVMGSDSDSSSSDSDSD